MDRQRILIIFGAAWISAALLTWFFWSRTSAPQAEKTVKVVAVIRDMAAGQKLKTTDVKTIEMPAKDLPKLAMLDMKLVAGRALLYPIMANEPLTSNKLSSATGADGLPATIDMGMRAVSIPITDASGVAGLIQPRSHVDVLFTRPGSMAEAMTTIVLEDVVVLSIGRNTEVIPTVAPAAGSAAAPAATNISVTQARAVTLLVTPEDARKIELAKNQGRLSLALRNPLDKSRIANNQAVTAEVLDPDLFTRVRRPQMVGGVSGANIRDPQAWATLTGEAAAKKAEKAEKKDPPKPRLVVDVFRGDKHLQESFQ